MIDKAVGNKDDEKLSTLLSRADSRIDTADMKILAALSASGVSTVPKEKLLPSEAYKTAKENGAKGIAVIHVRFQKTMFNGVGKTGTMAAAVIIDMRILDPKNGKAVFLGEYFGQSQEHIPVAAGIYDPTGLAKLFPSALDAACAKLAKNFAE